MAAVDILLRYRHRNRGEQPTLGNALISLTAGSSGTVINAPGAGYKLLILEGEVAAGGAGTWTAYHTAVDNANRLNATTALSNNSSRRVGPWELPENQPFVVACATQAIGGWCMYMIVPV